jgi:hypothetical protein
VPDGSLSPELTALLPQIAQQPAAVADQLKALADSGDRDATILAAWAFMQAGRWPEGVPYAERAAERGATMIAANYASNMIGAPEHRPAALRLIRTAMENGWQVDPLGWLSTVAQQNDAAAAAELVALSTLPWPRVPDERIEALMERLQSAIATFDQTAGEVDDARTAAVERIQAGETKVNEEVARLSALGHKVEILAHEAASDELSRQYAKQAKRNERSAFWFEAGALLVGAGAAVLAAYFTLKHATENPNLSVGLAKAGIAIPVALFAAFLARLATRFRRMAWRWRHVELQLRTAEPYIAELGDEQRTRLLEQLALRFFPGQPLDVTGAVREPKEPPV